MPMPPRLTRKTGLVAIMNHGGGNVTLLDPKTASVVDPSQWEENSEFAVAPGDGTFMSIVPPVIPSPCSILRRGRSCDPWLDNCHAVAATAISRRPPRHTQGRRFDAIGQFHDRSFFLDAISSTAME